MTQQVSYNCIVCAEEFADEDTKQLHSVALSGINITKFKICQACLNISDPADDYREARSIVNSYLKTAEAKKYFEEAKEILKSLKK